MSGPRTIDERAAELAARHVPFVRARVVFAQRPTSAHPGDQALVLADGTIEGFVGGACAESTVRAQSLALLDSGASLLLRISPEAHDSVGGLTADDGSGRVTVHNPCLSGGTLEIFLEPVLPAPALAVIGETPIARAVAAIGAASGFRLTEVISEASAVVIASHGRGEIEALNDALDANVAYVGLVASPKRGAAVLGELGRCCSVTSRVSSPAGLDVGARTPQEIALSILAEVVAKRPRPTGRSVPESAPSVETAIDPVCSMTVAMVESSLHYDHNGTRTWFCGSGCLRAYAANPAAYESPAPSTSRATPASGADDAVHDAVNVPAAANAPLVDAP
jgi:xanthine dehydrogenase accessory factor